METLTYAGPAELFQEYLAKVREAQEQYVQEMVEHGCTRATAWETLQVVAKIAREEEVS